MTGLKGIIITAISAEYVGLQIMKNINIAMCATHASWIATRFSIFVERMYFTTSVPYVWKVYFIRQNKAAFYIVVTQYTPTAF
jgi:hypothetical protein